MNFNNFTIKSQECCTKSGRTGAKQWSAGGGNASFAERAYAYR
jgi:hypothetical protein